MKERRCVAAISFGDWDCHDRQTGGKPKEEAKSERVKRREVWNAFSDLYDSSDGVSVATRGSSSPAMILSFSSFSGL